MKIEFYGVYYTAEPKILGDCEQKYIQALKDRISYMSQYESNLIVNLTWLEPNDIQLMRWINKHAYPKSTKIYFTGFIDGMSWFFNGDLYRSIEKIDIPMEFIGFHPANWETFLPALMKQYDENELALGTNPEYSFLSYNRKPRVHRFTMINLLIENNLISSKVNDLLGDSFCCITVLCLWFAKFAFQF